ncbi:MAG: hypothetical protein KDB14_25100 [Planctomycetales bacterium]|nr:hypothetical protein [Planctomycetales bacterium]
MRTPIDRRCRWRGVAGWLIAGVAAVWFAAPTSALARGGFRGGGGGGGGMSRPSVGGGMSRPSVGGGMARPSVPNLGGGGFSGGGARPGYNPGISRPDVSRPSVTPPSVTRPSVTRPSVTPPSVTRPSVTPPSTWPGGSRPSISPPPQTRPSPPQVGGFKPGARPTPLPAAPSRPSVPGISLPGGRPSTLPARPTPGDLGDFLGMDRPVRPDTRPAVPGVTRPGEPRPGITRPGSPPVTLPSTRPGAITRPELGDLRLGGNRVINTRPTWVDIDRNRVVNIQNRWTNQLGNLRGWDTRYPNRVAYWHGWGDGVRRRCAIYHHHHGWFGRDWWSLHRHPWCGWHYGYAFPRYGWGYWWRVPQYSYFVTWFPWAASTGVWTQPIYYDYGAGGNVVYNNNVVYINNQEVATADEFAQSAAALATVAPPESEQQAESSEWLPLGTFAISSADHDLDPTRVLQLAVNKDGIVSGTFYNTKTEQAQSIQGRVDRATQRVAFRIGESENIIVETGLYNLTQNDVPVLVHFGADKVEQWLLVRLDNPEAEEAEQSGAAAPEFP